MGSIIGIPGSRVSDVFIREQLLNQIQVSQQALFRIQTQLSTGHRFDLPSEDPVTALQVMNLQSLLERKAQIKTNLDTNQSYLSVTDSALSNVSDLLNEMRSLGVSMVGATATDVQRLAAANQVEQVVAQLMNTGNQQFSGRYLFSGSEYAQVPFVQSGDAVQYVGNEQELNTYSDINQLFNTNLNGNQVFGAISSAVQGSVKITPTLTYDTRLSDMRHGLGISKGSILVSDGTNSSTIDISGAETIGDLAAIIHANPPAGRELYVDITADKIILQLDAAGGGNFSIREVGGGTVADELGIRRDTGVGNTPIVGRALDPILRGTTSLQNILGAHANTNLHSTGTDNDILIYADAMGATTSTGVALNNVDITLVDDPAVTAGHEFVEPVPYNGLEIRVHIDGGVSRAYQVVSAINNASAAGDIPFTAKLDPSEDFYGGQGVVTAGATGTTRDGAGEPLDQQSGFRIVNGGQETNVSLVTATTVEDLLNSLNADSGLLAEINQTRDGINLRTRDSGTDFMIGENGGHTAAQLGLRSFTQVTQLADLNYGLGVHTLSAFSPPGSSDFSITRADGVELNITLGSAETISDVLDLINHDPLNADGDLVARLSVYGNGIELVDNSTGAGSLTITPGAASQAAYDLGLVPVDGSTSAPATVNYAAKLVSAAANSAIIFTVKDPSSDYSGVEIAMDHTATGVTYDSVARKLTVGIALGTTTAANVVEAVNNSSAGAIFSAELDPTGGNPNDGSGVVDEISEFMTEVKVLDGSDVNEKEAEGIFTALLRLKHALENSDTSEIERAMSILEESTTNVTTIRAEIGTRQQSVDVMLDRNSSENIEIRFILSNEYDADLAEVVSDIAGRQAAYEASLRATANILGVTLLDFL
jgi:flagellin-like hook-associated protein FlgL